LIAAGLAALPAVAAAAEGVSSVQAPPESACQAAPIGEGRVARIIDGRDFVLDDGLAVRLAAIEVPLTVRPGETGPRAHAAAAARAALAALIAGQHVTLRGTGTTHDRYGRTVAQVYVTRNGTPRSVGEELVATGYAEVGVHTGSRDCADEWLAQERRARTGKLGLWAQPYYVVLPAAHGAQLLARQGWFAIAQGKVVSVRRSGGTIYVNFGRRWSETLTVTILKRRERMFRAAHLPPESLEGRRIRVRGFIEDHHGPSIAADSPGQIELATVN
jgi:endonuclease YncB( thermonuclease family)